ncbi:MAG: division/cell wall cluster transcriptional repressor MraZ [Marinilabiliales bacterium]|nr:MAG: division/cell wall cluster transcriptional repressor MraZ [Marinilabiliales bacterium]
MATFIGDYTCRVDAKGRVIMPSAFKKQMPPAATDRFVVKKDVFEQCLVLFPIDEWDRQNSIIRSKINPYNREHSQFLRGFYKGTAEVILDASNRLLIPRRLLDLVEIEGEAVLAGQDGKIEIWSKDLYAKQAGEAEDFAVLAEKIMGESESSA